MGWRKRRDVRYESSELGGVQGFVELKLARSLDFLASNCQLLLYQTGPKLREPMPCFGESFLGFPQGAARRERLKRTHRNWVSAQASNSFILIVWLAVFVIDLAPLP